jgi:hypothetical protein
VQIESYRGKLLGPLPIEVSKNKKEEKYLKHNQNATKIFDLNSMQIKKKEREFP